MLGKISRMAEINKYAVIVAGGKGQRMGNALPKQFLPLKGKPILSRAIQAFIDAYADINIILVLPKEYISYAQIVISELQNANDIQIVVGGETRFHSVQNGLGAIKNDGIVFIHDGARPLVTTDLIKRCFEQAMEKSSAIPAIVVAESVREIFSDGSKPINREVLRISQTHQTFATSLILPAFNQTYSTAFTDEATVVEAFGKSIYLIQGEKSNIKVTTPEDLTIANALLEHRLTEKEPEQ